MANVTFTNGCPGFLAGNGTKGLVVIQEWWGLNEQIRLITQRFAASAHVLAVAPDL